MIQPYVGAGDPDIENFHHLDPQWQEDPHQLYDKLRSQCPVGRTERFGGYWLLSTYDDVYRAYQEPELFSSFPNTIPESSIGSQRPVIPVEIDPPDHGHYRKILSPLFTVNRITALEGGMRQTISDLLDPIVAAGECEFVSAFGKELPTRVFLGLMGWPLEHSAQFLEWCDVLMRGVPGVSEEESNEIVIGKALEVYGYFAEELEKRDEEGPPKTGDGADFIDTLRAATFAGERELTQFEILDCIFIVLLAGLDTTQGVLSHSMEFLATHEQHRKDLIANPEVLPSAAEELVRWFAPVAPGRRLTRDAVVGGVPMSAGDRVLLLTASACRDGKEFPEPDVVDFRRDPNRHLGFGAGIHRCLGSHLARMELRTALEEWHKRIPDYHLAVGKPVRRHLSQVAGIDELHLVLG